MFTPHRIDNNLVRRGDIVLWKGGGLIYQVLSFLIKHIKERNWDRWGWHLTPMISDIEFLDAQFPKVTVSSLQSPKYIGREFRAYRIFETPPDRDKIINFITFHIGCPYDFTAYVLTALALLLRPKIDIPRIINRRFHCWELSFDFADDMGFDISDDYNYPFLTDLLRECGELK